MHAVLVAGGTGALGGAVLRELLDAGHPVTATWVVEKERERVAEEDGLSLVQADLMDPNAVAEAVNGVEDLGAVVNLVGGFAAGSRVHEMDPDDWEKLSTALGRLSEAPMLIDETPALNAIEVRSRARRLQKQYGQLGLVIVDYIQLMQAQSAGENRATEISEISRSLKALAKELKVPVVALSQLNRSLEQRPNKRPVMSDLRESGAIEQDADVIFFIYRDEVYNEDSPDKGIAEIIIGKQRNGPIGTVKLTFLGKHTRFENYSGASGY